MFYRAGDEYFGSHGHSRNSVFPIRWRLPSPPCLASGKTYRGATVGYSPSLHIFGLKSAINKVNMNINKVCVPKVRSSKSVRVTIASDWAPLPYYQPLMRHDTKAVYGELLPLLNESDVNVVNVECVLGNVGEPIAKGGPCLRAGEEFVSVLAEAPFHVATLANNHSMDFGSESLDNTLSVLRSSGLECLGAGKTGEEASKPLIIRRKGLRLAILNCAEGEACASLDNGPGANCLDIPVQISQIKEMRSQVDAIVMIVHGGREYAPLPPPYFVKALRQFAEAGADAVIAHHAHVPQGIEIHGNTPIVYSQGNFIFQPSYNLHYTTIGYLVHLDFSPEDLVDFSITPYKMAPKGLEYLRGEALSDFMAELETVSRLLKDPAAVRQLWDALGDIYGLQNKDIQTLLSDFAENPKLAAARLHNYFFAPAHREYALHNLKRVVNDTFGDSPEWAQKLVCQWTRRQIGESSQILNQGNDSDPLNPTNLSSIGD